MKKTYELQRGWITSGQSKLWNCNSTYCTIPTEYVPKLGLVDEKLDWLEAVSSELRDVIESTSTLDSSDNQIAHLDRIIQETKQAELQLPESFLRFMRSPHLQAKVPTCTDCFLALSEHLIPFIDDQFVLRFLNDSQGCVMWYLLLKPQDEPKVLASYWFLERDIFEALNDEEDPINYNNTLSRALICANSFPKFLYRFWIENTIWYSLHKNLKLTSLQQQYLSLITTKL
jgi:hypothetical protein